MSCPDCNTPLWCPEDCCAERNKDKVKYINIDKDDTWKIKCPVCGFTSSAEFFDDYFYDKHHASEFIKSLKKQLKDAGIKPKYL